MTPHDRAEGHAAADQLVDALNHMGTLLANGTITLGAQWAHGPQPTLVLGQDSNASAHAKLAAVAHLPALENAFAHWAGFCPLLWQVGPTMALGDAVAPTTDLTFRFDGGIGKTVEGKFPYPRENNEAWNINHLSIVGLDKKNLILHRFFRTLTMLKGPFHCWLSTMNAKTIRFVAGPSQRDAIVVDRLIRACKTTLSRGVFDPSGTVYAKEHNGSIDLPTLAKDMWG